MRNAIPAIPAILLSPALLTASAGALDAQPEPSAAAPVVTEQTDTHLAGR